MGTPARTIAAIVFVAALAAVLAAPVLGARDRSRSLPPTPVISADHEQTLLAFRMGRYPRSCLRPVSSPPGIGLIATGYNRTVEIGTPDAIVERFRGRAPVSWSPSGVYLAWGRGQVHDVAPLRSIGGSVRLEEWAWSPVADCLLGLTEDKALVVRVATSGVTKVLVPPDAAGDGRKLDSFELSGDGRYLRIWFRNGSSESFDLERSRPIRKTPPYHFREPRLCAEPNGLSSLSCSPSGAFVVGERGQRVFLAGVDGSQRTPLAGGRYLEAFPEWGPAGTGVLFLRKPVDGRTGAVWFVPEGGSARPTPFVIEGEGFGYPTFPWVGIVDWNVSPPVVRCGSGAMCFPM